MEKKVAFGLLILCGFASQGFCTSSEGDEQSPDLHIRKKRLVGHTSHITEAPFLASLIANGINHCPATILTNSVVLTSAECLKDKRPREWMVKSYLTDHQVVNVVSYGIYNASSPTVNNLALAFLHPPINFYITPNRPIKIYSGYLATVHEYPSVFNWDHLRASGQRKQSTTDIDKVILQLISYDYCHNYYPGMIGAGNICTQSTLSRNFCQPIDTGAPLVIKNELLGIFAYRGKNCQTDPDVFMNLKDHDFRRWIHEHVPALRLF